jgi:hypothetical protein
MITLAIDLYELGSGLFAHPSEDHAHFLVVPILEYFALVFGDKDQVSM